MKLILWLRMTVYCVCRGKDERRVNGNPEDFINNVKIRRVVEAADLYLKYTNNDKSARFDIIAVVEWSSF